MIHVAVQRGGYRGRGSRTECLCREICTPLTVNILTFAQFIETRKKERVGTDRFFCVGMIAENNALRCLAYLSLNFYGIRSTYSVESKKQKQKSSLYFLFICLPFWILLVRRYLRNIHQMYVLLGFFRVVNRAGVSMLPKLKRNNTYRRNTTAVAIFPSLPVEQLRVGVAAVQEEKLLSGVVVSPGDNAESSAYATPFPLPFVGDASFGVELELYHLRQRAGRLLLQS